MDPEYSVIKELTCILIVGAQWKNSQLEIESLTEGIKFCLLIHFILTA